MGYRYIALGGMVPLKTPEILSSLRAVDDVRLPDTRLHLLGISRTESVNEFQRFGVVSIDSTSPFRQAFKDDKDNYYAPRRTYVAVRVPQIDANHRLKSRILAGELDQNEGRHLEAECLDALMTYARRDCDVDQPLSALRRYDEFLAEPDKLPTDKTPLYRKTLKDRPWEKCKCGVCTTVGIHVVIFRGTERNKRRGFHNLFVFNHRLHKELALAS
jgi:hypothetical protein